MMSRLISTLLSVILIPVNLAVYSGVMFVNITTKISLKLNHWKWYLERYNLPTAGIPKDLLLQEALSGYGVPTRVRGGKFRVPDVGVNTVIVKYLR